MGGVCSTSIKADVDPLKVAQGHLFEAEQNSKRKKWQESLEAYNSAIKDLKALYDKKKSDLTNRVLNDQIKELLIQALLGAGDIHKSLQAIDQARLKYQEAQKLGSLEAETSLQTLVITLPTALSPSVLSNNTSSVTATATHVVNQTNTQVAVNPLSMVALPQIFHRNPLTSQVGIGLNNNINIHTIVDTRELAQRLKSVPKQNQEYLPLQKLALGVINAFAGQHVKSRDLIEEVIELAKAEDEVIIHELLAKCIDPIVKDPLSNLSLVDGLAKVLHWCNPALFSKDDLVQTLKSVTQRLIDIHRQLASQENEANHYSFLRATSHLLDAMVDIGVQGLSREKQHEQLYLALESYNSGRLGFYAQYCRQALVRIPNDESRWAQYLRRGKAVGQATSSLWTAVKSLDPLPLLQVYENLKEAGTFQESVQPWYDSLRYASLLLEADQWLGFEYFIKNCVDKLHPGFVLGVIQLLDRAIKEHIDKKVGVQATQLLGQLFEHYEYWASEKNLWKKCSLKIWDRPEGFLMPVLDQILELTSEPEPEIHKQATKLLDQWHKDQSLSKIQQELLQQFSNLNTKKRVKPQTVFSTQLLEIAQKRAERQVVDTIQRVEEREKAIHTLVVQTNEVVQGLANFSGDSQLSIQKAVIKKLQYLKTKVLGDKTLQQELSTYIPSRGVYQQIDTETFDLEKTVDNFLEEPDKKVFLLLGNAGGGKSTFNRWLERSLWDKYQEGQPIPLRIPLVSLRHFEKCLLTEYLKRVGFTSPEIEILKQQYRFVFILDGYDEMKQWINLYNESTFEQWQAHTIIACRTDYTDTRVQDYRLFFMPYQADMPQEAAYCEAFVAPFDESQINSFINRYVEINANNKEKNLPKGWDTSVFLKHIGDIPGLSTLVRTPFLLMMTLKVLPDIAEQYAKLNAEKRVEITQVRLYDAFFNLLFKREKVKLMLKGQLPKDGHDVTQDFWGYVMKLALMMDEANSDAVEYVPKGAGIDEEDEEIENPWEPFFGTKPPSQDPGKAENWMRAQQACTCVLRTIGENCHAFIHSTMKEHLVAKKMQELVKKNKQSIGTAIPTNGSPSNEDVKTKSQPSFGLQQYQRSVQQTKASNNANTGIVLRQDGNKQDSKSVYQYK